MQLWNKGTKSYCLCNPYMVLNNL